MLYGVQPNHSVLWESAADTTPPVADILDVTPDPRTTPVGEVTIQFSEPVTGFTVANLTLIQFGVGPLDLSALPLTTTDQRTFTINLSSLTTQASRYSLLLSGNLANIQDLAGRSLTSPASDSFSIITLYELWIANFYPGVTDQNTIGMAADPNNDG